MKIGGPKLRHRHVAQHEQGDQPREHQTHVPSAVAPPRRGSLNRCGNPPAARGPFVGGSRQSRGGILNAAMCQFGKSIDEAGPRGHVARAMAEDIPFNKKLDLAPDTVDRPMPGVRRVMANNPGPFTFKGTMSYIDRKSVV